MSQPPTIASQVDAVARELGVLIDLLGGGHAFASGTMIADAIAAVESTGG